MDFDSTDIVTSREIGLKVLDWLRKKNELAYMRFASVYKDFKTLEDFKKELKSLNKI